MMDRRSVLAGVVSLIAAPAIVRASSLMPVKAWLPPWTQDALGRYHLYELKNLQPLLNHLERIGEANYIVRGYAPSSTIISVPTTGPIKHANGVISNSLHAYVPGNADFEIWRDGYMGQTVVESRRHGVQGQVQYNHRGDDLLAKGVVIDA